MKRCKTCKHWSQPDGWRERSLCDPIDPDTYKPAVTRFDVRVCRHPEQTFCERPLSKDGFGIADGSTYMATLATAEDFGCVRHERS